MEKTAILTRDDLERLRKKAGFRRQEDFATACGVSAPACRHWLSGARPLPTYAVHVLKMSLWIKEHGGDPTAIVMSPPRESD